MPRKQYKDKKCCCTLCKPHKRGWSVRWKAKEASKRKAFEKAVAMKRYATF